MCTDKIPRQDNTLCISYQNSEGQEGNIDLVKGRVSSKRGRVNKECKEGEYG
jgi:hypothetical protein